MGKKLQLLGLFLGALGLLAAGAILIKQERERYANLQLLKRDYQTLQLQLAQQTLYLKTLEELQQKAYIDYDGMLSLIYASSTQDPVGPGVNAYFDELCRTKPDRCPDP